MIHLKVGRAVNLNKRIDQWGKQCGSKEQVLRGWWPGTVEDDGDGDGSLMKARVKAGEKGENCHRLERLVHLELADLVLHAPYLHKEFPKMGPHMERKGSDDSGKSTSRSGTPSGPSAKRAPASPAKLRTAGKPCPDCEHSLSYAYLRVLTTNVTTTNLGGQMHKEIFSFRRPERGRYKGREWELLVKPVIEKWGAFVKAYV